MEQEMDPQHDARKLIEFLTTRPKMFVPEGTYYAIATFLDGYDTCCVRLDLDKGFHGWLLE
ncbi:MAG: hypothetical protein LBK28_00285, partial [Propionibacteriaceae bacterium]|nr:hypothetical protein [Propionibacteriaceae bacterium]